MKSIPACQFRYHSVSIDPAQSGPSRPGVRVSLAGVRICLLAFCLLLPGCSGLLKPVESTERQFLLTSLPASRERKLDTTAPVLGISRIKLPEYLLNSALAVRRGSNEVAYLPDLLWAERLDSGLQRVLAANLGTLLPTSQIRLSSWSNRDVNAELHVVIEQFDLDDSGRGVLIAWWRVLSPGGEKTLRAGEGRFTRQGVSPHSDPAGGVATLSRLVEDLSRQLGEAIQEAVQVRPGRPAVDVNSLKKLPDNLSVFPVFARSVSVRESRREKPD